MHTMIKEDEIKTIGDAIRFYRQKKRIKLKDLCEKVGITIPYLMILEKDKTSPPNLERIKQLATALDIDHYELLKYSSDRLKIKTKDQTTLEIIEKIQDSKVSEKKKTEILKILNDNN